MGTIIYDSSSKSIKNVQTLKSFKTYIIEIHGDGGGGGFSYSLLHLGGNGSSGTYIKCEYTPKLDVEINIIVGEGGKVGTSTTGGKGGSGSSIIDKNSSIVSIMAGGGGGGETSNSGGSGANATTGSLDQKNPTNNKYNALTTVVTPTNGFGTGGGGSNNGADGNGTVAGKGGGVGGDSNVFVNTDKGTIKNIVLSVSTLSLGGAAGAQGTKGYVLIKEVDQYVDSVIYPAIYSTGVDSTAAEITTTTRTIVAKANVVFNVFVGNYDLDNNPDNNSVFINDVASAFLGAATSYLIWTSTVSNNSSISVFSNNKQKILDDVNKALKNVLNIKISSTINTPAKYYTEIVAPAAAAAAARPDDLTATNKATNLANAAAAITAKAAAAAADDVVAAAKTAAKLAFVDDFNILNNIIDIIKNTFLKNLSSKF